MKNSKLEDCLPSQLKDQFEVVKQLGQGTEGVVYEIKDKKNKEIYALKLIRNLSQDEYKILNIFKENNHRNIINIFGVYEFQLYYWILMEYCDKSLYDQIQQNLVEQKDLRYVMVSIADGLKHLHSLGIIHRDLKPENILVKIIKDPNSSFSQSIYKICDFGLSKIVDVTQTQQIGTCYYMAPELISNQKYDKKVDIWSFGTIIYELVTGKPLFDGQSQNEILNQIMNLQNQQEYKKMIEKIASKISEEYLSLIQKMLIIQPSDRYNIDEVVRGLRQRYSTPPKKLDTPRPIQQKTLGQIAKSSYEDFVKQKNYLDEKFRVNNHNDNEKKQNFIFCQYQFDKNQEIQNDNLISETKKQQDDPSNFQQTINQNQNNSNQLFQQGTQQFQQNIQQNQPQFNHNQQRFFSPQNDKFKVFNKIENNNFANSPRIVKGGKDNQPKFNPANIQQQQNFTILTQSQQNQTKQIQQNKLTTPNQNQFSNFSHINGKSNEFNAKNINHSPNSHIISKDSQINKEFPFNNQQQQLSQVQQFQQQKPSN